MPRRPDEDLFAETTMSFGEHLEELRFALSKALIGLLVAFLIGLCVANYVVMYIQTPLKKALEDHYITKAIEDLKAEFGGMDAEVSADVEKFIRDKRFVYHKLYVEASEITRISALAKMHEADSLRASAAQTSPVAPAEPNEDGLEPSGDSPEPSGDGAGTGEDGLEPSDDAPEPKEDPVEPSDGERTTATQGDAEEPKGGKDAVILGGPVPPPEATFVYARVWQPIDTVVKALNAQEAFMIWLKAAFVSGLVIASPFMFWQIWTFVAAGLYPHEKKYVFIYLPFSTVLFLAGAATAFFLVFQYVLEFLFTFNKAMNIDPDPRISEWLSFVLMLPLGFGIAFQLPLVMLFLHRIGIFSISVYWAKWRIAVLVIFVISMLLTPADPISMLLMALPLTFLYFLGIGLCHWMPRNKSPFAEGYEP